MKAFVADDDPEMLAMVAENLRCQGIDVFEAVNGADLVRLVGEQSPADVVITDINMPVMDGLAVLSHMQRHHPEVPVVLMTAFPTQTDGSGLMKRGAVRVLIKPFGLEELEAAVSARQAAG